MRTLIALGVLPFILFPLVCSAVKLECELKFSDGSTEFKFIDTDINSTGTNNRWTVDEDKYERKYYRMSDGRFSDSETIYRSSGKYELFAVTPSGSTSIQGICKPAGNKKKF